MRTSRADNNFFAICDGETNCQGGLNVPIPPTLDPEDPASFDSIIKLTGAGTHDRAMVFDHIAQGREAAGDCNNEAHTLAIRGPIGRPGETGETIWKFKGGVHDIALDTVVFSRSTKGADFVLGEYSDQSRELVYGIDLSRVRGDTPRIFTVSVGRAKWPTKAELGPYCRVLILRSIGEKIAWWSKDFAVRSGAWALYLKLAAKFRKAPATTLQG